MEEPKWKVVSPLKISPSNKKVKALLVSVFTTTTFPTQIESDRFGRVKNPPFPLFRLSSEKYWNIFIWFLGKFPPEIPFSLRLSAQVTNELPFSQPPAKSYAFSCGIIRCIFKLPSILHELQRVLTVAVPW